MGNKLEGKIAVITGATSGIGLIIHKYHCHSLIDQVSLKDIPQR
jgi:NADP-dependent 3-hydroxy acid dehydrogenase YdfG